MMHTPEDITAVVLCGGKGTRLRSLVPDRPKALVSVGGREVIFRVLDWLAESGIRRCVLCTGFMGEAIRESVGETYGAMRIEYSHESRTLGTGGAALKAVDDLGIDQCLVLNGDTLFDAPLRPFLEWSAGIDEQAGIMLTAMEDARDYGLILLDPNGRVESFREKPTQPEPGLVNAGVYYFRRSVFSAFPPDTELSMEKDVLPGLTRDGLAGFVFQGGFLDVGTPSRFADANRRYGSESGA
ncbi:sugar phosphate nucleotidyltransferase [uncultured Pseudodesulfovibrio sp.]|uniref:nucleotidyltransferase family protein n=1 Tax=uncultured Pseudodesulfovibrio sp. TaxID=2035858 RepID=UPI0029C6EBBE|nr:sugar phosphate nucleotidyltransferase [uncultured Pseudodesulfovibrio sp.]